MTIVDLDELRKNRETTQFKLLEKEYTIPEMSYALTLHLDDIRKKVTAAAKKNDYKGTMDGSIETILKVVPNMDAKELREKVSVTQLRKIVELINEAFIGKEESGQEKAELAFYRNKYGDEYRKKGPRTKERKKL